MQLTNIVWLHDFEFPAVIAFSDIDLAISIFNECLSLSCTFQRKCTETVKTVCRSTDERLEHVHILDRVHREIRKSASITSDFDLYWWQLNLLDVYAFIIVVIIIVLCIVLFVLRKLKNLLFGSPARKDSAVIKFKKNKWRNIATRTV